jgi:ABC-2 type transport system permease protein
MLKTIFLKTLYQRRKATLGWTLGFVALSVFVVSVFHSFSGVAFQQTISAVPGSLKGLIGSSSSYGTIDGYVNQQLFIKSMPILILVFAVIVFSGLLAGDEGEGTLQVLLTHPVSRSKVLLEKFMAGVVMTGVVSLGIYIGAIIGVLLVHETVNYSGLFRATIMIWLLTLVFGSFTYMLGAITGKRGLAGSVSGVLVFSLYLISSLAAGVTQLMTIDKISPFHYYGNANTNLVTEQLSRGNITLFGVLIIVFLAIGLYVFKIRDIYQP